MAGQEHQIAKLVGTFTLIVLLLIAFAIISFTEFVVNPYSHYSFELVGRQIAVVEGLNCRNDPLQVNLRIVELDYSRKDPLIIQFWYGSVEQIPATAETISVRSESNLIITVCGQVTTLAYVWRVFPAQGGQESGIHLRMKPEYQAYVYTG